MTYEITAGDEYYGTVDSIEEVIEVAAIKDVVVTRVDDDSWNGGFLIFSSRTYVPVSLDTDLKDVSDLVNKFMDQVYRSK